MKIAVSAQGDDLNAPVSPTFGRCPTFVLVDTRTNAVTAVRNAAQKAPGGAGPQAAQLVADQGAEVVITNKVGPRALSALKAAGVSVYGVKPGTVGAAVEAYKAGELQLIKVFTG
jgi:predicted Fe-Mo cluster-binding NifX family protein